MEEFRLYNELLALFKGAGIEVRVEIFQKSSERGGGICRLEGLPLVLLDGSCSRPEQTRTLLESLEQLGLGDLGLKGTDLSPELLSALNRRGRMPWPHRHQAPSIARTGKGTSALGEWMDRRGLRVVDEERGSPHFQGREEDEDKPI
ncbi:MAG: hypothetical protein MK135_15145 [Polyangiaceae bacterium]|nr:hypothetical protein [Polyangiaceae bacterium]